MPQAYLFRADDFYRRGAVGRTLGTDADAADIQSFVDHVLHKGPNRTSRYVSFTNILRIARKFTNASDNRHIRKVALARLRDLESQGIIRIWDVADVCNALAQSPKKIARWIKDVRAAMQRNRELLIEGQIPEELFKRVK